MPDYLLDTNIVSYWQRGHSQINTKARQVQTPEPQTGYVSRLFISVVTLAEIEYGHKVAADPDPVAQADYRAFLSREKLPVLDISRHIHEPYATLRAWLFRNCAPRNRRTKAKRAEELVHPTTARELGIDENDLWIAAHAALNNLVLVTVDGLSSLRSAIQHAGIGPALEDWTQE